MKNQREKVISSAKKIFINKGFEGARMQEIADDAGINKGLLHYYFKSKENLFFEVIKEVVETIRPKIDVLIKSDISLEEKIVDFVEIYIDLLIQNPYLPAFVLSELNLRGESFFRDITAEYNINPTKVFFQVQAEIQKGKIRNINPFNLLVNMISMCVFPFIARPIFKEISGLNDEEYFKMMELRKKEVSDFILMSIRK